MALPSLSYRPPQMFQSFGLDRDRVHAETTQAINDDFFDPRRHLSARRAVGLFASGLALAFSARWLGKALFRSGAARTLRSEVRTGFETNNILKGDTAKLDELNISQGFHDSISPFFRLIFEDKNQLRAFLPYLGSSAIGYIAGSAFQGVQETWVRREETGIRAHLIARIQDVFKQSIRTKQTMDNQLKENTRARIVAMLSASGIANAKDFANETPMPESQRAYSHYFYEPTHRTVVTPAFNSGFRFAGRLSDFTNSNALSLNTGNRSLIESAIVAAGAVTGFAVQGIGHLFKSFASEASGFQGKKVVYETIQITDREAWWINGVRNPKNLMILGGFLALSAGAKIGKLFIDGLRQVEVTRTNANTEYEYQKHNWLSLDPGFHQTAETEAVNNDLCLLQNDLPALKQNPTLLRSRVQAVLENIGRNSAPKYFPMTPMVGLVDARS